MFEQPCRCGHGGEKHYWKGMQRQGACKADGCTCATFREARGAALKGRGAARGSAGTT